MRALLLSLLLAPAALAQAPADDSPLAALAPLVGAPWQATFETPEGATATDVSRFEWAVRGHALRNVHGLADGSYGGETLIWAAGDSLRFVYVTTGGFTTQGTGAVGPDGALVVMEEVAGHPEIDRVRSVSRVDAEGLLRTVTEFRRGGVWEEGRRATYVRTPGAALPAGLDPRGE